ncbi:MAG: prolipoprotein diacylglyceryl transferase [Clostridia bacterium]
MDPIAFSFKLFSKIIEVRWYALILTSSMLLALVLLVFNATKKGYTSDLCLELFLWILPLAILFARLFFSLPRYFPPKSFSEFVRIFDITEGGLTIVGGVFGGAIGAIICCIRNKKPLFKIFDLLIPSLLLGQCLGRWGNFVNQEVYGVLIQPEWLHFFPIGVQIGGEWHYASFFIESFFNFCAFIFFMWFLMYKKERKVGMTALLYLCWYNFLRAFMEFFKEDPLSWHGIKLIQLICFIVGIISVVFALLLHFNKFTLDKFLPKLFLDTYKDKFKSNNNYAYADVLQVEENFEDTTCGQTSKNIANKNIKNESVKNDNKKNISVNASADNINKKEDINKFNIKSGLTQTEVDDKNIKNESVKNDSAQKNKQENTQESAQENKHISNTQKQVKQKTKNGDINEKK